MGDAHIIINYQSCFNIFKNKGLTFIGAASLARDDNNFSRFSRWLELGMHAQMSFMQKYLDVRRDPSAIMEHAASALVFGLPYYLGDPSPGSSCSESSVAGPQIAQYARFKDYHHLLRKAAESAMAEIIDLLGQPVVFRVFVDTAPLYERALAAQSQVGFIGKNRCYIHPEWGSYLLLGEIITTTPLGLDGVPVGGTKTGCGRCQRCIDQCPTAALDEHNGLDARRCMAYWTIEHRGFIPESFWPPMKEYWFGCDICGRACPHNSKIPSADEVPGAVRISNVDLYDVALMDQEQYQKWFGGSAMTRAKIYGLKRNALIAMYERGDPRLSAVINKMPGDQHPVVIATIAAIKRRQSDK